LKRLNAVKKRRQKRRRLKRPKTRDQTRGQTRDQTRGQTRDQTHSQACLTDKKLVSNAFSYAVFKIPGKHL
jgi:hypothetical protein